MNEAAGAPSAGPVVLRAGNRFVTDADGMTTRHSFSYGAHYDPTNVGFGHLNAINEETIAPTHGYGLHRHSGVEIVTWVLEGALLHEDTTGQQGTITPGTAQRLSAGSGVEHSESNASQTAPLRFLQMMLRSANTGAPAYTERAVPAGEGLHELVTLSEPKARLLLARCGTGRMLHVAATEFAYVHVCAGNMSVAEYRLGPGDALRMHGGGSYDLVAGDHAEALVWQMQG